MNNEIIEFLLFKLEQNYKCEKEDYFILYKPDIKDLLDYITNLQGQLHQASLDIQELTERDLYCPTNCDKLTKLQKENEYLKKNQRFHKRFKEGSIFCLEYDKETLKDLVFELQQKIDKAIEHIEKHQFIFQSQYKDESNFDNHLLDILKGDSDE